MECEIGVSKLFLGHCRKGGETFVICPLRIAIVLCDFFEFSMEDGLSECIFDWGGIGHAKLSLPLLELG